ncbi:MAG: OprD family porin [Epsilonproteobacteria bacterium]|nr:OprD family porin [Campylobacterota bacterium]
MKKASFISLATCLLGINGLANDTLPRVAIKTNGQVIYYDKPQNASNFKEIFSYGKFYGRIRTNNFYWNWKDEDISHNSHFIGGVGGSAIYKSAKLSGLSFGAGLYYSYAYFRESQDPYNLIKAGKDVASRYDYLNMDRKYLAVLGQAYLDYVISKTNITVGRQLVETFYTKSNDTKMIPNTFDGVVLASEEIPSTSIKLGYLLEQKLRDHATSHPVLMYGDSNYDPDAKVVEIDGVKVDTSKFSGNDDSAMHRGLTYTALKNAGEDTDAPLIVGDIKNNSIKPLKANMSFYVVPGLLSQVMGELNYKFTVGSLSIIPGVRYIQQIDDNAGAIGGASLSGKVNEENPGGYTDPNSLDSYMIAARIVTKIQNYKINLAYTGVADEADLVTPWRGFPTAGYTRSMGAYNWKANTKSYRLEVVRNANKTGIYKDVFIQASILFNDFDEDKGVGDQMYYYVGFVQNLPSLPELQWRLRIGYGDFTDDPYDKYDYLDSRFEINYVF